MKKSIAIGIAVAICVAFAVIGGLLTGDAIETWFAQLRQPAFALPVWGWMIVGLCYYIISITVLSRVLIYVSKPFSSWVFWLTLGMIAGNESWNYLLFGLQSPQLAFFGLFPYFVLVVCLFWQLRKSQPTTAWILFPYLIWLIYDLFWAYFLWKMNLG